MFTQKWMDTYFTVDIAIQIGISLCILLLFIASESIYEVFISASV